MMALMEGLWRVNKQTLIHQVDQSPSWCKRANFSQSGFPQMSSRCHPQEAPLSRGKRTVDESKTCCLLHLHADHLYYRRFKSVKAVVAQVTKLLAYLGRVHVITSGLQI